jgi:hypothetical protein
LAIVIIMTASDSGVVVTCPWPMATEIVSPGYHRSLWTFCFHSVDGMMLCTSFGRSMPVLSAMPSAAAHLWILSIPSMLPSV